MTMRRSVSQKLMSAPAVAPGERLWVPRDGAWVKGEVLAQANTLVTLELEDGAEHELDLGLGLARLERVRVVELAHELPEPGDV